MIKKISSNLDKLFISVLIFIFFTYNLGRIDYGLPFFINLDENSFQYSTLAYLKFLTGYSSFGYNPIYAPFFNLLLILNSIFFNELIFNSLSLGEIHSKIYFNPELFIFYGRVASLIVTSLSIFMLFLIFKRLKINFFIYSVLLISFSTSLLVLDISSVNGKNSYFLLFFLIQLFFFIKYLLDIEKFTFRSYIIFGVLASIAWGVNFWPAFISIYAIFFLHLKKYKFTNIHYVFVFLTIFIIFGPLINLLFAENPFLFLNPGEKNEFQLILFLKRFLQDVIDSFVIIYKAEKNIFLLLIFLPIFFLDKNTKFKKEFLIIFFLILEPIFLLSFSGQIFPQLRFFSGNFCIILILTALIFNELNKTKFKYFCLILIFYNFYVIGNNINLNKHINNLISKNHSFYEFNKKVVATKDKTKILYLVDLRFQESLKQNLFYIDLYENDLIKKSKTQKEFLKRAKLKIEKIKKTNQILIDDYNLKKDIIYFNYTFFEIEDLKPFFEYIKKDFDYVLVEKSKSFYLSSNSKRIEINNFIEENFLREETLFETDQIYLRSLRSAIHYYLDIVNVFDLSENIENDELEKVYGSNYALYNLR